MNIASHDNRLVDEANKQFWDELCGSSLAIQLGITDNSLESLNHFDRSYLAFYPYLLKRIPIHLFAGRTVLEVGLGYGTLGQKIAEAGALYQGMDIASGPVFMMNHRLSLNKLSGKACQGSILESPFDDNSFDIVVSIGCFHHTGNVQRCVDETYRILKPGGIAYIMVYNKYSYRNWLGFPFSTMRSLISGKETVVTPEQRGLFDANADGVSAPETVMLSITELSKIFDRYSSFDAVRENFSGFTPKSLPIIPRTPLLLRLIGPICGLDIYVVAVK